ncbi:two-component sensor histidine kinase [Spirochaetia bacterium]|nr:two-component sensor histidine kinase [Spirochaetia bacterium]
MPLIKPIPKLGLINVRVLLIVYILICALTLFFSGNFINDILFFSKKPQLLFLIIYFTIPVFLLVLLAFYAASVIHDIIINKPGSKFQLRLITNFIIVVVLTAIPVVLITLQSFSRVVNYWPHVNVEQALIDAQSFAAEAYAFRTQKFEEDIRAIGAEKLSEQFLNNQRNTGSLRGNDIAAVQEFSFDGLMNYKSILFVGDARRELNAPPAVTTGFKNREMPRDTDTVRYVDFIKPGTIRVISFSLGEGFDESMRRINEEEERFLMINSTLMRNVMPYMFFYLGVFLFPILLITIIITITFTRIITQPIVELGEATKRVAKGDFTVQILSRPNDELGQLVSNFNAMVQNLEKTQNALVRSEKISIWQSMAQQLAHEIKNPLTPIKLTAERLLRRFHNNPEKTNEIIENSMMSIIQEVESLTSLLDEFKTLSRPIEASSSKTNIRETLEDIIAPYITSCPDVIFDTSRMTSFLEVRIERKHLTQIINNLVINAIDAMNSKGRIDIRTDLVNKRESRYCRLSIQDTGKGISREDKEKVFTPYWTSKESGTGLGLPIVERIITDYGGGIWFNSAEGAGTTFFVDLPVIE